MIDNGKVIGPVIQSSFHRFRHSTEEDESVMDPDKPVFGVHEIFVLFDELGRLSVCPDRSDARQRFGEVGVK